MFELEDAADWPWPSLFTRKAIVGRNSAGGIEPAPVSVCTDHAALVGYLDLLVHWETSWRAASIINDIKFTPRLVAAACTMLLTYLQVQPASTHQLAAQPVPRARALSLSLSISLSFSLSSACVMWAKKNVGTASRLSGSKSKLMVYRFIYLFTYLVA